MSFRRTTQPLGQIFGPAMLSGPPYGSRFSMLFIAHHALQMILVSEYASEKPCTEVEAERHCTERGEQADTAEKRDGSERTSIGLRPCGFTDQDVCNDCVHGRIPFGQTPIRCRPLVSGLFRGGWKWFRRNRHGVARAFSRQICHCGPWNTVSHGRFTRVSGNQRNANALVGHNTDQKGLAMTKSAIILATVSALALTAIASTRPAEARRGFGPGLAGGLIAGAVIAGAASSAYAWAPGYPAPVYGYGGYGGYGPGYYGGPAPYGYSYGGYDQSQHGGQPYPGR